MDRTDTSSHPPRWWVLKVSGDLDISTGPDLEAQMGRAMAQHRGDGFVLDLSAVTFMDCAALRPVLRFRDQLQHRLCLRPVPVRVRRLLELADVARGLRILADGEQWPVEADPGGRGNILDDRLDRHPDSHRVTPAGDAIPTSRETLDSMATTQPEEMTQSMEPITATGQ